jgi:hypothetical protein
VRPVHVDLWRRTRWFLLYQDKVLEMVHLRGTGTLWRARIGHRSWED